MALYIHLFCLVFEYSRHLVYIKWKNISNAKSWFCQIWKRSFCRCELIPKDLWKMMISLHQNRTELYRIEMFGNGEHGLYENNVFISFLLIYFSLSIGITRLHKSIYWNIDNMMKQYFKSNCIYKISLCTSEICTLTPVIWRNTREV